MHERKFSLRKKIRQFVDGSWKENTGPRNAKYRIVNWPTKVTVIGGGILYIILATVFQWKCPILKLTGIPCPGCGMTRAVLAAVRGEWYQATQFHSMVWTLPLLLMAFLYEGKMFRDRWINVLVIVALIIGFFIRWVILLKGTSY